MVNVCGTCTQVYDYFEKELYLNYPFLQKQPLRTPQHLGRKFVPSFVHPQM